MGKKQGFTLVELLVVISILAILTFIGLVALRSQLFKGNDAKRKADLDEISNAAEEYEKDEDCYPSTLDDLLSYLEKTPTDPSTGASYTYEPDPESPDCPKWYRTYAIFENKSDASKTELCPGGCGPTAESAVYDYYVLSPNAPLPVQGSAPGQTTWWCCVSGNCVQTQSCTGTGYVSQGSCEMSCN